MKEEPVQMGWMDLNVPTFHVSSFQSIWAGNDLTVICANPTIVRNPKSQSAEDLFTGMIEGKAILTLSPQSAKDLALVLLSAVEHYEGRYGKIVSEYTLQRKL